MDKSDLLEEWDVVSVTSVYETEKEDTETDTENKETEKENADSDTKIEKTENQNLSDTVIEETKKEDTGSDAKTDADIMKDNGCDIDANIATVSENIEKEDAADTESETLCEPEGDIVIEPQNKAEALRNTDSEPQTNILDSECNIEPEFETILTTERESSTTPSELESHVISSHECDIRAQSDNNVTAEDTDLKANINSDVLIEDEANVDIKHDTDNATELNTDDDNIVEDIVHVESPVNNNNLDSSMLTSETGSDENDIQDTPELVPERIQIEQEMASIESSSSDIDIIDENMEESISSSFISPLSLSLSSSVADASSIQSLISSSDDNQSSKPKETIQDTTREKETWKSESTERKRPQRDVPPHSKDKSESVRGDRRESHRTTHRRSFFDWFSLLIELFRSMSGYDWCIVGGVAVSLYLTVVINQTNIFAVVQKENVVAQMKDMINELKNDNKVLKEQMLSELKNKKAISSFEHQIRELRKENSKLSHMLYDVAKVLDKQKYSHEKKESEYLAPFKKEINKLKEHINILKFDNEELQKELVRMRYGSYAQGDSETMQNKGQPGKKENTRTEEDISAEETPQDIENLKKWNELITLLTQELSSLTGVEGLKNEKFHSDAKNVNSESFWKSVVTDFKGTFNDLRKFNFTALLSDYRKANQKAVSDVYKFVKDFFSVAEHSQQYSSNDDSQWKNIGDFVSDLKEKWNNIKDRLYASDLKQFFEKHLKNVAGDSQSAESSSQKTEGVDSKISSTPFKTEKKIEEIQTPDETKWMFKRAAHREELRNVPEQDEELNWYLKKGRDHSEKEKKEKHF